MVAVVCVWAGVRKLGRCGMTGMGWAGRMGQVLYYLRVVGADTDADGRPIIGGAPVVSFMGMSGDDADVIVPADTVYFVGGKPSGLASGLGATSYGTRVTVIG